MTRTVVVTGVAHDFAARFARSLAALGGGDEAAAPRYRVIGIDLTQPRRDLGAAEFVRADIRSPVLVRLLNAEGVDVVVHPLAVDGRGRSAAKDYNVIATLQLAASCQKVDTLDQIVLISSTAVYGSTARDPVAFTEDVAARQLGPGRGRDCVEAEGVLRQVSQRRPDLAVCILRLADLLGAGSDTDLTRYLSGQVVPRIAGFDARLQFLHPTDAVRAMTIAVGRRLSGTYNVAAAGVVTLSQALRLLGRASVSVPRPAAGTLLRLSRRAGLTRLPDDLDAVTFGRCVDTMRFEEATGFRPGFSSREAFAEFVALSPQGPLSAQRLEDLADAAGRLLSPGDRRG